MTCLAGRPAVPVRAEFRRQLPVGSLPELVRNFAEVTRFLEHIGRADLLKY
jgi:hypothetical protein